MQQSPSSPPPAAAAFSASPQDRTNAALQHVRAYPVELSESADNGERWPTDEAREAAIKTEGNVMQECMSRYWNSNCLTDRADADAARVRMQALIAGRSPEQVQRMTAAQAERMAREPGAERTA